MLMLSKCSQARVGAHLLMMRIINGRSLLGMEPETCVLMYPDQESNHNWERADGRNTITL